MSLRINEPKIVQPYSMLLQHIIFTWLTETQLCWPDYT